MTLFKFKKSRASSVLGLSLDASRLEAIVLRRTNGTLQIRQTLSVPLTLSPLADDPELVGREIRNLLDQAGIRERRCAVSLPVSWVLTLQTKLPDLPEADLASFLQIEAERGFPSGHESIHIGNTRFQTPSGENYATMLGVPKNHLEALEKVLRAAKLKAVSFALGIAALQKPDAESTPVLALVAGASSLELQVTGGGGVVAVRSLDGAIETEGSQKRISAELAAREIRITMGQLPGGFAAAKGKLKLFGQGEMARQFAKDITARADSMGLKAEVMTCASNAAFDKAVPSDVAFSPALALAANWLKGANSGPEFLPPKVSQWQQLVSTRLSSRKLAWVAGAAGAAVFCVCVAFGVQQWQISSLQSKWSAMEPQVTELDNDQQQIRKYRPWFDESFRGLRILRKLTQSFPEDGSVSAKTVEIKNLSEVTCSGVARDNQAFLAVHGKLGDASEVSDLHAETRGKSPMQFTVNFQWEGETANGN